MTTNELLLTHFLRRIFDGARLSYSGARVAYGDPVVRAAFDRELLESRGQGRGARLVLTDAGRRYLEPTR